MINCPGLQKKADRYSNIIVEEHRKPKSERRPDLLSIVNRNKRIRRWIKEFQTK